MPSPRRKPALISSSFFVPFPKPVATAPVGRGVRPQWTEHAPVRIPLRWWNTFYKSAHTFTGGRVEVLFDDDLVGFHKFATVDCDCPYCKTRHGLRVEAVNAVKGQVSCGSCGRQYGVHPAGQMFVVRDITSKVTRGVPPNGTIRKLLNSEAYHEGWTLEETPGGVTVVVEAADTSKLDEAADHCRRFCQRNGLVCRED